MTERAGPDPSRPGELRRWAMRTASSPEQGRLVAALRRVCHHAERELDLLERSACTRDREVAREFAHHAEEAYRDALSIMREHDIEL